MLEATLPRPDSVGAAQTMQCRFFTQDVIKGRSPKPVTRREMATNVCLDVAFQSPALTNDGVMGAETLNPDSPRQRATRSAVTTD
jgi:hypothetical protein